MLATHRGGILRVVRACTISIVLLAGVSRATAQVDFAQQAAAQAQQDTRTAVQAAQQANTQTMQASQQANQQAEQDARQASMVASRSGTAPRPGYGRAGKPRFSPDPGKFTGPVHVSISSPATPKAEIFFTVDGSTPTTASTRYSGPVLVTSSTMLRAIARSPIYSSSRVAKGKFVIR